MLYFLAKQGRECATLQYLKQVVRFVCVGIFAFWATVSVFSLAEASDYVSQSIPFVLVYALLAWQMWSLLDINLWERPLRRVTVAALALALCFSVFTIVGDLLHTSESLTFSLKQAELMGGMLPLLFVILWRFLHWSTRNVTTVRTAPPGLFCSGLYLLVCSFAGFRLFLQCFPAC